MNDNDVWTDVQVLGLFLIILGVFWFLMVAGVHP